MDAVLRILAESSVRAIMISLLVAAVLWVMQVKTPSIRHWAWTATLLAMLLLPAFLLWVPRIAAPVLPIDPAVLVRDIGGFLPVWESSPVSGERAAGVAATLVTAPPLEPQLRQADPEMRPVAKPGAWEIVIVLYLLGLGIFLAKLLLGTVLACRLARSCTNGERVSRSERCAVPLSVGFLHPRVILPVQSRHWSPALLDSVLAHELEHVRRRDPLIEWLAMLVRCAYWFHPLAWWLRRKLAALAEEACDEAVLHRGHDPETYAELLVELARSVKKGGAMVTAWGSPINGSGLAMRIRRILTAGQSPALSHTRTTVVTVLCAVAILLPVLFNLEYAGAALAGAPRGMAPASDSSTRLDTTSDRQKVSPEPDKLTVRRITFVGPRNSAEDRDLRAACSSVKEGRSYRPDALEKCIAAVNKLAIYKEIGKADCLVTLSEGVPLALDIEIRLTPKGSEPTNLTPVDPYRNWATLSAANPKALDAQRKIIRIIMRQMNDPDRDWKVAERALAEIDKFLALFPDSDYAPIASQWKDAVSRELAQAPPKIAGCVYDPAGDPVAGVEIQVANSETKEVLAASISDEKGCFEFRTVQPKHRIELRLAKPGFNTLSYSGDTLPDGSIKITMQLGPPDTAQIRIRYAQMSYKVADYYYSRGNYLAAISRYQEAIGYQPDLVAAHNGLGRSYEARGENEKALAVYKEFLDKFPGSPIAPEFKSRIAGLEKKQPS